jgi:hypothetical protein
MDTVPALVSEYIVEDVPEVKDVCVELKLPVLLLVLQVIVPVGLDPDTVAVQVTGEPIETGLGEHVT